MKTFSRLFAVALLTLTSSLAFAAGPTGLTDKPHEEQERAPDGWQKTPSGLYIPGSNPTIAQRIEIARKFYVPGRPPPGKPPQIIVPGVMPGASEKKILLPHPPGDPSRLVVVHGESRAAIAESLAEHGNYREAVAVGGREALHENWSRPVPARMVAQAHDIMPAGVKREVSEYVPPKPAKDAKELVGRVFDHFFVTGNMPGENKVIRGEGAPPVADKAANQVYENSGSVFAFYKAALGRFSIDDKGMPIRSVVHQRDMDENGAMKQMSNAYYKDEDKMMRYGDGDGRNRSSFTGLDIAGHELTHGVTAHTAGLVYKGESGALNESFSDVLGMAIRQWKQGVTVDKADWRLGADSASLTAPAGVKAIRSMSDPASIGKQPAHMRDFQVIKEDQGGVHTNSGIPNRAFYGAATRIGGYVWDKSAKIWYVALRDYLKPNATFQDAARATAHVAAEMYGEGSREHAAVIAGWKDVGITVSSKDSPMPLRGEQQQQQAPAK